ncbi:protein NO VEIN domain-containing protein [Rhodococcus coprophilus]|uniref:protein NO VEIN domain-containing protein n=1 Tax=Rhodococcus coprophilus TaxID=38310 RepID=UPI00379A60C9
MSHSEFGDITPTQYDSAYEWLCTTGLLDQTADVGLAASRIFETAVETGEPAWFRDADELVPSPDDLPEDALRAAEALGLDLESAFAHVSHVWGKVDTAARERVGSAGELALLELLQQNTTAEVLHVAAFSDGYGYDISVRTDNCEHHLEVKSTTRRGRVTVFLSRNEYSTMMRDPSWHLVLVTLNQDMEITGLTEIPRAWVKEHSPSDASSSGCWESARFNVSKDSIQLDVPFISEYLAAHATSHAIELLAASRKLPDRYPYAVAD